MDSLYEQLLLAWKVKGLFISLENRRVCFLCVQARLFCSETKGRMLWLFCTFNYAYLYPHVHILFVNPFKQSKGLQTTLVVKYYIIIISWTFKNYESKYFCGWFFERKDQLYGCFWEVVTVNLHVKLEWI